MYDDSNDFYSEQCMFSNNTASIGSVGVFMASEGKLLL